MTTAEPPATFIKYPNLCTEADIDVVGINPHSYFNANISPENSGSYIVSQKIKLLDYVMVKMLLSLKLVILQGEPHWV